MRNKRRKLWSLIVAGLWLSLFVHIAWAAPVGQGGLPWESFLGTIQKSISGPVATGVGIIAIAVCGLVMAFADLQSGGKRALTIGLGLSIAFTAATLITKLWPNAAGAIIH